MRHESATNHNVKLEASSSTPMSGCVKGIQLPPDARAGPAPASWWPEVAMPHGSMAESRFAAKNLLWESGARLRVGGRNAIPATGGC